MKKDVLLFPGWMQNNSLYPNYSCVNLWEQEYVEPDLTKTKYLLGHSMGSLPALLSWEKNPDTTIILFNPLITKRSKVDLVFRFIVMMFISPGAIRALTGSVKWKYLPVAIKNAILFREVDALKIIKKIPKDKLIIIKGKNDNYFCDIDSAITLCHSNIAFIELADVNHFWCLPVDVLIKKFIK